MIIKNIFRRYERWNPVHPTYGAFWGMGVGLGCGIGWGPGFGPEVIGYVGAGCGAGFSVGVTFLGVGIGLPANYFIEVPYSVVMVTTRGALDVARAGALRGKRGLAAGDHAWGGLLSSQISETQHNPFAPFSSFKIENWTENIIDCTSLRSTLASNAKHITDCFQRVRGHLCPWDRGSKT